MKVWDEDEVLRELVAAHSHSEGAVKLPFLLLLAKKVHRKGYEFIFLMSETYERIDGVFQHTDVILEDGVLSTCDEDEDQAVWIHGNTSSEEEDDSVPFESYHVGKAMFHTASGETLLKVEGSPGWKEALKQKFHSLECEARSRATAAQLVEEDVHRNHTTAKAVASAAIGGTVATGSASAAAAGLGYTASGITAGSYAAGIMSAEAVASGGSVAAGGFTATMQSIGAVGVMASPVGVTLAAAGAIGGLGAYYMMHRRNQKKKKEEEEKKLKRLENMAQDLAYAEQETTAGGSNDYQRLSEEDTSERKQEQVEFWVLVSAKRIEMEDSEHCFDHEAWDERTDADQAFLEVTSNTTAKALFDPRGVIRRVDCDPADRDGWETALSLHYNFCVQQNLIALEKHGKDAREDTPLLKKEES